MKDNRKLRKMNQEALSKRFGHKSKSRISARKDKEDFPQWSKSQDPEGKTWRYDPIRKLFVEYCEQVDNTE